MNSQDLASPGKEDRLEAEHALRIIFMGTPQLASQILQSLLDCAAFRVVAVVTQPDRPKGRDLKLVPTPVKEMALRSNIPVLQPERARDDNFIAEMQRLEPDLIAVAAFGQILPKTILDIPRFGCLNVHTSLLPKYRGAAPIQRAILDDEPETGVTIMKMDVGLDTGAILVQQRTPVRPEDDGTTLQDRLAQIGARLLVSAIVDYSAGRLALCPQPAEGVSYAAKIKKEDGRVDWTQPARSIWNRVRGLIPWPGAFTTLTAGPQPVVLKLWQSQIEELSGSPGTVLPADKAGLVVACGTGSLRILSLQREGGRRLTTQQFLAGYPLPPGTRLGS